MDQRSMYLEILREVLTNLPNDTASPHAPRRRGLKLEFVVLAGLQSSKQCVIHMPVLSVPRAKV